MKKMIIIAIMAIGGIYAPAQAQQTTTNQQTATELQAQKKADQRQHKLDNTQERTDKKQSKADKKDRKMYKKTQKENADQRSLDRQNAAKANTQN